MSPNFLTFDRDVKLLSLFNHCSPFDNKTLNTILEKHSETQDFASKSLQVVNLRKLLLNTFGFTGPCLVSIILHEIGRKKLSVSEEKVSHKYFDIDQFAGEMEEALTDLIIKSFEPLDRVTTEGTPENEAIVDTLLKEIPEKINETRDKYMHMIISYYLICVKRLFLNMQPEGFYEFFRTILFQVDQFIVVHLKKISPQLDETSTLLTLYSNFKGYDIDTLELLDRLSKLRTMIISLGYELSDLNPEENFVQFRDKMYQLCRTSYERNQPNITQYAGLVRIVTTYHQRDELHETRKKIAEELKDITDKKDPKNEDQGGGDYILESDSLVLKIICAFFIPILNDPSLCDYILGEDKTTFIEEVYNGGINISDLLKLLKHFIENNFYGEQSLVYHIISNLLADKRRDAKMQGESLQTVINTVLEERVMEAERLLDEKRKAKNDTAITAASQELERRKATVEAAKADEKNLEDFFAGINTGEDYWSQFSRMEEAKVESEGDLTDEQIRKLEKTQKIREDLDKAKKILHQNIEAAIERGDKLSELKQTTSVTENLSKTFNKNARKLTSNYPAAMAIGGTLGGAVGTGLGLISTDNRVRVLSGVGGTLFGAAAGAGAEKLRIRSPEKNPIRSVHLVADEGMEKIKRKVTSKGSPPESSSEPPPESSPDKSPESSPDASLGSYPVESPEPPSKKKSTTYLKTKVGSLKEKLETPKKKNEYAEDMERKEIDRGKYNKKILEDMKNNFLFPYCVSKPLELIMELEKLKLKKLSGDFTAEYYMDFEVKMCSLLEDKSATLHAEAIQEQSFNHLECAMFLVHHVNWRQLYPTDLTEVIHIQNYYIHFNLCFARAFRYHLSTYDFNNLKSIISSFLPDFDVSITLSRCIINMFLETIIDKQKIPTGNKVLQGKVKTDKDEVRAMIDAQHKVMMDPEIQMYSVESIQSNYKELFETVLKDPKSIAALFNGFKTKLEGKQGEIKQGIKQEQERDEKERLEKERLKQEEITSFNLEMGRKIGFLPTQLRGIESGIPPADFVHYTDARVAEIIRSPPNNIAHNIDGTGTLIIFPPEELSLDIFTPTPAETGVNVFKVFQKSSILNLSGDTVTLPKNTFLFSKLCVFPIDGGEEPFMWAGYYQTAGADKLTFLKIPLKNMLQHKVIFVCPFESVMGDTCIVRMPSTLLTTPKKNIYKTNQDGELSDPLAGESFTGKCSKDNCAYDEDIFVLTELETQGDKNIGTISHCLYSENGPKVNMEGLFIQGSIEEDGKSSLRKLLEAEPTSANMEDSLSVFWFAWKRMKIMQKKGSKWLQDHMSLKENQFNPFLSPPG